MTKEQMLVEAYRKSPMQDITINAISKDDLISYDMLKAPGIIFRKNSLCVVVCTDGTVHRLPYSDWTTDDVLRYLETDDKYKDMLPFVKGAINDFKLMELYDGQKESILFDNRPEDKNRMNECIKEWEKKTHSIVCLYDTQKENLYNKLLRNISYVPVMEISSWMQHNHIPVMRTGKIIIHVDGEARTIAVGSYDDIGTTLYETVKINIAENDDLKEKFKEAMETVTKMLEMEEKDERTTD